MEELTPQEKEAMRQLSGEKYDASGLEDRIVRAMEQKGLIDNHSTAINMKRITWQIAAALILLVGGYFIGRQTSGHYTSENTMNQYALFLYENDEFTVADGNKLVSEYSAWAQNLGEAGKLAYAEKLNDSDTWLGSETVQNRTSRLTGYFVFYAKDLAEAQEIARTHPHTSYGGGLELRPIDKIE
jgi:hypothetical protein